MRSAMDSMPHMIGQAHVLTECRSPNPPGDGKDIANGKGDSGDGKPEGNRMVIAEKQRRKPAQQWTFEMQCDKMIMV